MVLSTFRSAVKYTDIDIKCIMSSFSSIVKSTEFNFSFFGLQKKNKNKYFYAAHLISDFDVYRTKASA